MNTLKRKEKSNLIVQKFGRLIISPKKKNYCRGPSIKLKFIKCILKLIAQYLNLPKKGIIFMV